MSRQNHFYRGLMLKLNRSSTEAISIENYEIRIFRSDFMHIHEYLCRVSFLTILDIYKDYFKGYLKRWKVIIHAYWRCKGIIHAYCDQRQICPSSSYSLKKLLCLRAKGFVTKELLNLHCWMNWKTLQPTSSPSWCVSHVLGFMHWKERLSLHFKSN